ncbi:Uncharacterised protein [Klebsiella pneumoniae subsp. pneumoniae]|nr:Uncharacterised protein [Klebsiella pneumoniae subsp. pneumoniae]
MVVSREASRPPPIPSKKALVAKAQVLMRKVLTPHGDRRIFIVANSFHHPAILRPHQLEDHAGGQQGEQPAPEQEMRLLRNIVQPDGAVGDLRVVNGEDLDDKPKAEGDNGQVVATYPERPARRGTPPAPPRTGRLSAGQGGSRVQAEDPRAGGRPFQTCLPCCRWRGSAGR